MSLKTKNSYWTRLDVKLTIYYTSVLLILSIMLCSFFFYRLSHNLLKQIDKILKDESYEFLNLAQQNNFDLLLQLTLNAALTSTRAAAALR